MEAQTVQIVNSVKLTKLEQKILQSFSQPAKDEYYPEGHSINEIALLIYGSKALTNYSIGNQIKAPVKSSLSRSLKQLHHKGLVKKGVPIYRYGWIINEDLDGSAIKYYGKIESFLKATSKNDNGLWHVESLSFKSLPDGCHVWWMLTGKAKEFQP